MTARSRTGSSFLEATRKSSAISSIRTTSGTGRTFSGTSRLETPWSASRSKRSSISATSTSSRSAGVLGGRQGRQARRVPTLFDTALAVDANQADRQLRQARDQVALEDGLARQRGAQGERHWDLAVVPLEDRAVLPQCDGDDHVRGHGPTRQTDPVEDVVTGHPQFHEPRLRLDHGHRPHAPCVTQTLGGRGRGRRAPDQRAGAG